MAYRLGVDLGTTFTSAVLLREHAAPEVFALGERSAAVPTVLYFGADGTVLYGEAAETRALTEPGRVVRQFKRRVGDEVAMVVAADAEGLVQHHAHDLAAAMIAWVVATVVAAQGGEAPDALAVTHPATWGPHKTELLRNALAPHGLANLTLVSEPEAAAYTYAYAGRLAPGDTLAVYDVGGGTFDAAVLHADADGRFAFLGRALGLQDIGGIDFDDAIFAHVLEALTPEQRAGLGIDDRTGDVAEHAAGAIAGLRAACTAAKEELSTQTAATVPVTVDGKTTQIRITRAEFETMIVSLLLPTLSVLDHCADSADIATRDVTAVLLAGGSSRIPLITQMLSAHMGPDVDIARDVDPKMAVAAGAVLAITALAPEARAAAAHAGPSAVTGLARARARADKAARGTRTPPVPAAGLDVPATGKVTRLKDAGARALPHSRNSTPQATPMTAAPAAPAARATATAPAVPAQAAPVEPDEPVAMPRGITTEAGKAAYERLATAKAARVAATATASDAARTAMNEVDALLALDEADDAEPRKPKARRRRKAEAAESLDLYTKPMPAVSYEEAPATRPVRAQAKAQVLPVAPPPPPAKGEVAFVQPKGKIARPTKEPAKAKHQLAKEQPAKAKEQPAKAKEQPAPAKEQPEAKPVATEPAEAKALPAEAPAVPRSIPQPMKAGEIGTGRPIRPHRQGRRADVVGPEAGASDGKLIVPPRPVGALADLLGADPREAWAPDAAAQPKAMELPADEVAAVPAEVPAEVPDRPSARQAFFADGELVDPEAGEDDAGRRWHTVLTMRRVFSTRRILTVVSLTAALFIGSGSAALSPITAELETKAASHVTKSARK